MISKNSTKITILLLIRHGDTDKSWIGEYQEPPGPPLSSRGKQKILSIKDKLLNEFTPDEIYVSSYKRSLGSLQLLINNKENFIIDSRLNERKTNESFEDVKRRVISWLNECVKYDGKTMWLCSHCSPINTIIQLVTPFEFTKSKKDERSCVVPKGGVWLIEWKDRVLSKSKLIIGTEYFENPMEGD